MQEYQAQQEISLIGNKRAGSARQSGRIEQCFEILRSRGAKVELLTTEHREHATELAAAAGGRLVVAGGGDGTVNEVINGLSKDATLGIIPLGTANVLARELGLPLNIEEACERILSGNRSLIDLGVAADESGNERRFACMAGMGFDAHVVNEVTPRLKRYLRMLAFPLIALKVYFEGDLPEIQVVHGDITYVAQFAIAANGHFYGGDFRVSEAASLTNSELEVVLVERVGLLLRADILARILVKSPLDRAVRSFPTREIQARSPGAQVPVQLDGESWGRLPMTFRIDPGAIEVIR